MEIETNYGYSVFRPHNFPPENETIFKQSPFFLDLRLENLVNLALSDNNLFLKNTQGHFLSFAPIEFDLKFKIIYADQGDIHSQKIGLYFFLATLDNSFSLYTHRDQLVQEWAQLLRKYINQRGFHQMFKPIRKLGKGNFASVFEVQRTTDNARFAVKAFNKHSAFGSPNGRQSLMNQLRILRSLDHPNLLNLDSVYESDNSIYVVICLLNGGALISKINQRKGKFKKEEVRMFMKGLLQGLEHLHLRRIMHRDLKPQNIMFPHSGSFDPVIVDFGLGTNVDIQKYLFFRCGTPGYVAPEIIQLTENKHVEPQCDIFSAGVLFHIMLTGKPLFQGTKYQQVYQNNKLMNFNLDSIQSCPNMSPQSFDLLKRMLTKNPLERITAQQALLSAYFQQKHSPVMTEHTSSNRVRFGNNMIISPN